MLRGNHEADVFEIVYLEKDQQTQYAKANFLWKKNFYIAFKTLQMYITKVNDEPL